MNQAAKLGKMGHVREAQAYSKAIYRKMKVQKA